MNSNEQILQNLAGMNLGGSPQRQYNSAHNSGFDYSNFHSLHVGNLPKDSFYDLDLYKYFSTKGYKLRKAKVVLDRKTSKSYGYGYLTFNIEEEALRCLKEMNNASINGHQIVLSMKQKKDDFKSLDEKANILVKNIDKEVKQGELYELFSQFGAIQSCKLESYTDGSSRGFAYI